MKPEHIFGNSTKEMEYYGTGVDLDRMITVAQSGELLDLMIDSFDLYKKYNIDPKGSKARYKAYNTFRDHYKIEKTKLDALELTIEDKDPKQAAAMANATRYFINLLVSNLLKSNLNDLATTIKDNIVQKQIEVNKLADSVQLLRNKFKIIDPESQAPRSCKRWSLWKPNTSENKNV
jgi:capsule polysaccharide export protein KpsE/RkpR